VNENFVIQVQIQTKLMFKKMGQVKLLISFLCIPAKFYFVAVLTRTMKVKNKHISVGLSNCGTSGLSEYQTVGLTGCRIIATLPPWT